MKAYLLVQTAAESAPIAWELRSIPGVESADDLQGPYDAIAVVKNGAAIDPIVSEIQRLSGITRVLPAPLIARNQKPEPAAA